MRRILVVSGLCALCAFPVRADFELRRWKYLRPLGPADGFVRVELDRPAYVHTAPGLADLRVVDASNAEVPNLIRQELPGTETREMPARLLNLGRVERATVFEIDAGEREDLPPELRVHNRLSLEFSEENFVRRVEIAASVDSKQWRVLVPDGILFNYALGAHRVRENVVPYPETDLRFLRVTMLAGEGKIPRIHRATLQRVVEKKAEARTVPLAVLTHVAKDQKSEIDFDLGASGAPADRITLDVASPSFFRRTEIFGSEDQEKWTSRGYGAEISRVRLGGEAGKLVEKLEIPIEGARARYLRVTVFNGDDAPLEVRGATITYYPHFLVFRAEPGATYRLGYGNPKARTPRYDLERQIESSKPTINPGPAPGPETENPEYEPEKPPLTERLPWLPNLALGLGGVALAVVLVRSIRAMKKA